VAIERTQRKPYPVMVKILNDRVKDYGGAACHDNSGLGTVVADLIEVPQGRIEHFEFAGRERNEMLSEYIAALEQGLVAWPKDDRNPALAAAFKEHLYATVQDVYGRKDEGHLPDTISAAALAWRACRQIVSASGVKQPDPDQTPHLQHHVRRPRTADAVHGITSRALAERVKQAQLQGGAAPAPEPDLPEPPKQRVKLKPRKPPGGHDDGTR